jgi:GntR family transcriptional regulator
MAQRSTRYQQIADELRQRIQAREFPAGKPMPSEGELQTQYSASRNTVREALKILQSLRLIDIRAGQGTFVTREITPFVTTLSTDPRTGLGGGGEEGATYPDLVRKQGRKARAGAPKVTVLKCPPEIAIQLQITENDPVISRHQERYIDETIWSRQTSFYPMKWVQKGADGLLAPDTIPEGAVKLLESAGLTQVGYRDLLSARLPDEEEQTLFDLTHNDTVIEVYRTSYTQDETPIRVTVTVFPSDRNKVAYDIGGVPSQGDKSP